MVFLKTQLADRWRDLKGLNEDWRRRTEEAYQSVKTITQPTLRTASH